MVESVRRSPRRPGTVVRTGSTRGRWSPMCDRAK